MVESEERVGGGSGLQRWITLPSTSKRCHLPEQVVVSKVCLTDAVD